MALFVGLSGTARATVIRDLTDEAVPRSSFYILVVLSTAIASYGLLANSTAVVIGAMLIAPLMGPLYGIALGLLREDRRLFFQASLSEVMGIILAVGLAFVIGSLPLRPEFGTEILVRTKPNLYDLLVAIAAGVAGAYARTSERVSPTLPGVAIATALVPPLAVCGLCLADGRWDAALGALLLFTTNLLAIEIAAGAVFAMAGLSLKPAADGRTVAAIGRRFVIPILLLIPIGALLLQTLVTLVRDDRLTRNLRRALDEDLHAVMGADVTELRHQRRNGEMEVVAVVLTPQTIEPALVSATEANLRRRVDPTIHLIVRSLISRDADRGGQVFLNDNLRQRLRSDRQQESFLNAVSVGLRQGLAGIQGAELIDVQREDRDSQRIKATVRTPVTMSPSQVALMQREAEASTRAPVELVVRSIVTQETNSERYLGESPETVVREQVTSAVVRMLHERSPEASVLGIQIAAGEPTTVTVNVAGFAAGQPVVEQLNQELARALGRPTRLIWRALSSKKIVTRDATGVPALTTPPRGRAHGRRP